MKNPDQFSPTLRADTKPSAVRYTRGAIALLSMIAPLVLTAQPKPSQEGGNSGRPVEIFRRMSSDPFISRDVTFAELGFTGPVVLGAPDSRREIYLPVPAGVTLNDAALKMDANYLRADGGRTSMIVSLDNYPVLAKGFTLDKGDASATIGIDGTARPSGFVRLGVNWTTAVALDTMCADARTPGNVLRI